MRLTKRLWAGLVGWNKNLDGHDSRGIIRDCHIKKVYINCPGCVKVGGLVGANEKSLIENSSVSGTVVRGSESVGGLAGLDDNGKIEDCRVSIKVKGHKEVGGLIGKSDNSKEIKKCRVVGS